MNIVQWPHDLAIDQLSKHHHRDSFESGVLSVDEWLNTRARQTLVNFDELPRNIAQKRQGTRLPILTPAWLGIDKRHQGKGFGERLLAQARRDCHETGQMLPFIAVLLDCTSKAAK